MPNSISIQRRLARLAGPDGVVLGLAIDHRESMLTSLRRAGIASPHRNLVAEIKTDICAAVAPWATALMIDAQYGRPALGGGALPPACGLIMPLEEQGYERAEAGHLTRLMPEFDPRAASVEYGADACKLLLPFRADHRTAENQLHTAAAAIALSNAEGLPIALEPIVFRRAGETEAEFANAYSRLVVEAVATLADLAPNLFKLPFPSVTVDVPQGFIACRAMHDACRGIPWVLLGAGASPPELEAQLAIARRAGAIGFLFGRAIWFDALKSDPLIRRQVIESLVVPRFRRLVSLARQPR